MQRQNESSGTTVVLVLSGTESERALPAARSVATRYAARIVVLHVIEFVPSAREGRRPLKPDDDAHGTHLRELVAQLRADGFDAELDTSTTSLGDPAAIIAAAARRHRAGMIVLTTRGPRPFVGNLAENVVQRLLHLAPCLVLVVTPQARRDGAVMA